MDRKQAARRRGSTPGPEWAPERVSGTHAAYIPAVDDYARGLIARIARDHRDEQAVLALAAHYESHADLPSLANLMEGWGQTLRDDRRAADAYARAAWAVSVGLSDSDRAERLYMRALERWPEHQPALDALEGLLRARGDDTGLERALDRVAGALAARDADAKLRANVHRRLGELYERRLLLPSRAIAHYRNAFELDPNATEAIAAARDIYLRAGKAAVAADMYELEIKATDNLERRVVLLSALAEHRYEAQGDLDAAVLALRRVLWLVPGDLMTLERLAELLRARSGRSAGPAADADRMCAAELYFRVASSVPSREARHRLQACLRLLPAHARAARMLARLDAQPLGAHRPPRVTPAGAPAQPAAGPTGADAEADAALASFLAAEEGALCDEEVGPERMIPISERPPPLG